jgi:Protein of unknown function (DUF2934)
MDDFDERVRQRAYRLWVEEGCPEGRSEIHWDKARELVAIEENQKRTTKPLLREQGNAGEPVEPIEAVENAGEFPTLTDQGEEQAAPQRRRTAASSAPAKRKTAEPKQAAAKPATPKPTAPKPAREAGAKRR